MVSAKTTEALTKSVLKGERRALAKTITLFEGKREDQRISSRIILNELAPHSGRSIRIGITGTPGVGKSTFIEAFGKELLHEGHKIAILAIDPSSPISGGSILGDRVRMEDLSKNPSVFIRPTPTSGALGGAARHTRETIVACEAAGYNIVIVESVGVGQSETDVASMTDCFIILQMPNAGDEIQGLKKGILELADLVVITKADGTNLTAAKIAKDQMERSLSVARGHTSYSPKVLLVSGLESKGIPEFWQVLQTFIETQKKSGEFIRRRHGQAVSWFHAEMFAVIRERILSAPKTQQLVSQLEQDVMAGRQLGSTAAMHIVDKIMRLD